MSEILANLMLVFVITVLVSLFYWHVVRQVLIQAIRYRLFARRDELRSLAIDGAENCRSFSYTYLESFINKAISFMPSVCLATFIFYSVRSNGRSDELTRFQKESSKDLIAMRNKSVEDIMLMMAINSPIMVLSALIVAKRGRRADPANSSRKGA